MSDMILLTDFDNRPRFVAGAFYARCLRDGARVDVEIDIDTPTRIGGKVITWRWVRESKNYARVDYTIEDVSDE